MADASCATVVQPDHEVQAAEHVSGNLMQDYNETAVLGLAVKGKAMVNVSEVDHRLKLQLDAAQKVFTTLESFCENLRVCALMTIIKDGVKRSGAEGQAWTIANNLLVATENNNIATGTPMSITIVTRAIELAQRHLEQSQVYEDAVEEINTPAAAAALPVASKKKLKRVRVEEPVSNSDQIKELQEEIAVRQRTLSALMRPECTSQKAGAGRGGRGYGWGKGPAQGGHSGTWGPQTSTGR
eukprot:1135948-Rhodomonas_salina.5